MQIWRIKNEAKEDNNDDDYNNNGEVKEKRFFSPEKRAEIFLSHD